ncbi:hypothetical protein KIPB_011603 [Kipferlia bialata]|uniref:Uncharacterized protein n=1 Tax=Kipferlia bialata TaxID=797122 RepID=A0A391NX49_9EUKA|nr:hypothetical protein KIPB_011603 [Kipferlia bialata]|eukprot:g11603.t1
MFSFPCRDSPLQKSFTCTLRDIAFECSFMVRRTTRPSSSFRVEIVLTPMGNTYSTVAQVPGNHPESDTPGLNPEEGGDEYPVQQGGNAPLVCHVAQVMPILEPEPECRMPLLLAMARE